MRLGQKQTDILIRALERPGLTTYRLRKGISDSNRPEKVLEEKGLLQNSPEEGNNHWFITEDGIRELKERDLIE